MELALSIAGGLLLLIVALKCLGIGIDWLDERSSRLTTEEAKRRAELAMYGDWPTSSPPQATSRQFRWLSAFMAALAGLWYWSRHR